MSMCLYCSQFSRCCAAKTGRRLPRLLQVGLRLGQLLGRLELEIDDAIALRQERQAMALHLGSRAHAGGGLDDVRDPGRSGARLVRHEAAVRAEARVGAVGGDFARLEQLAGLQGDRLQPRLAAGRGEQGPVRGEGRHVVAAIPGQRGRVEVRLRRLLAAHRREQRDDHASGPRDARHPHRSPSSQRAVRCDTRAHVSFRVTVRLNTGRPGADARSTQK